MNYANLSRIVGSFLLLFVAIVIGLGSRALWNGRPSDWPDLVASDDVVIASSRWALAIAVALAFFAGAAFQNVSWGFLAATIALAVLVIILFWGHYVLFGKWDLMHIAANVVVAGVIIALLKLGSRG
jgi:hypothetical protein